MGLKETPRIWEGLFQHALTLIDEIGRHGKANPFWTFGGGTVLMLRYAHRFSKDIDIFVPDPQYLGYVTPRLSPVAESITTDYTEAAGYVKLVLDQGEIDFVAAPNLTQPGFTEEIILGRTVKLETSAEIIAKKMWHRGDRITGRDIFDFALVAEKEPENLLRESRFMIRHADAIREQLAVRAEPLRMQFEAVETLNYQPRFDDARSTLHHYLSTMEDLIRSQNGSDHVPPPRP